MLQTAGNRTVYLLTVQEATTIIC